MGTLQVIYLKLYNLTSFFLKKKKNLKIKGPMPILLNIKVAIHLINIKDTKVGCVFIYLKLFALICKNITKRNRVVY